MSSCGHVSNELINTLLQAGGENMGGENYKRTFIGGNMMFVYIEESAPTVFKVKCGKQWLVWEITLPYLRWI